VQDQDAAARSLTQQIDALLPQTQCGRCGYPGCQPYAAALAGGEAPYMLGESHAIERYIATVAKLRGKNDFEAAKIDQICEALVDVAAQHDKTQASDDDAANEKLYAAWVKKELAHWNNVLEAVLKENNGGKGYFVGDDVSQADITLFRLYSEYVKFDAKALSNAPLLADLLNRVGARPNIAAWVKARPNTPW